MPSQRTHTTQSRKHARKAVPARFDIHNAAFAIRPAHQNCGNGTIWHNTGSGKTPTSFKASTLLNDNPDIEKSLFVVDRKANGQDKRCDPRRNLHLWSEAVCQTQ